MGKILIIVSVALTLLTAILGFVNKGKLDGLNTRVATAEDAQKSSKASLAKATTDLTSAKKDLDAANTAKDQATAQLTTAQTDATTAKAAATAANDKLTALTADRDKAAADLAAAQQTIADLQKNQTNNPAPVVNNEDKALQEEQKTLITKLQSDLDAAHTKLAEFQKIEETHKTHALINGTEGRILAVNPAWNFVVLSLGDKNGVVSNAELLVKRGNLLVGKIRVTSVEPSTSIADIVANSVPQGTTISPGDHVIYQAIKE